MPVCACHSLQRCSHWWSTAGLRLGHSMGSNLALSCALGLGAYACIPLELVLALLFVPQWWQVNAIVKSERQRLSCCSWWSIAWLAQDTAARQGVTDTPAHHKERATCAPGRVLTMMHSCCHLIESAKPLLDCSNILQLNIEHELIRHGLDEWESHARWQPTHHWRHNN